MSNFIEIHSRKIIKIEQKHKCTSGKSDKIRIRYFAACCLFIFILRRKVNNLHIKNNKKLKINPAEKCFTKISIEARDFGKKLCLF